MVLLSSSCSTATTTAAAARGRCALALLLNLKRSLDQVIAGDGAAGSLQPLQPAGEKTFFYLLY